MYSAWATSSPFASVIAVEKSRLEFRIWENEVRSIASPISSTMPTRRCWTTDTVIGSGVLRAAVTGCSDGGGKRAGGSTARANG